MDLQNKEEIEQIKRFYHSEGKYLTLMLKILMLKKMVMVMEMVPIKEPKLYPK